MQKLSAITILAFCLTFALCLVCDLPASGQSNDANGKIAVNSDYKLTVSDIQKLYKNSTDGLSAASTVTQNPATIMYSTGPVVPLSALKLPAASKEMLSTGVPTRGLPLTDTAFKAQLLQIQQQLLAQISDPVRNIPRELAQQLATQTMFGNSAAQVATAQANNAINYAGKFLINFTVNEGNVWNRLRNNIFVPIALLLLVPGTILTQTKAMMSAGNPVIETTNPFEGILRAVIAMCFIPASYLVVNYGIDFSNSISHTIQDAYRTQFGSDMYADAFLAEQRAFPSRQAAENQNGLSGLLIVAPPTAADGSNVSGFAQLENDLIKNKSFNADGTQIATTGLVDEVLPANAVAARMAVFGTNMVVTSVWDLLCAFQLVYLHYLFLVGPIMAAIWVYPIKQLREAWPNWIAGTITLCFWSLFWNTAILLMALFKDADSTGTFIMTALNLLATGSVKYAFDFVGLVSEAGQEAAKIARTGKNEQGGNLTAQTGPTTERTKTFSENTKEGTGGGLLGGISKSVASTALNFAARGAGQALSLGSQLLGGSKDDNSSSGLGDFAKSLSLPPLVSSVAESAFPVSTAAFGIVGAAGLMGKNGISLPPLAGAETSNFEQDVISMSEKTSGGGIETVMSGVENKFEEVSGGVGGKNGLSGTNTAASVTAMAGLAGLAISAISQNAEASTGTNIKAATESAPAEDTEANSDGPTTSAMRAGLPGAAGAPAGRRDSSGDVKKFMNNLAAAARGAGEVSAFVDLSVEAAGSGAAAAPISGLSLPPSAGGAANRISSNSSSSHSSNKLFKESARTLETTSDREFNYPVDESTALTFCRDISSDDAEMAECGRLDFHCAPPLSFSTANVYAAPPPVNTTMARLSSKTGALAVGGLTELSENITDQSGDSVFDCSDLGDANFYRHASENAATNAKSEVGDAVAGNTLENNMLFSNSAAIENTVSALTSGIEVGAEAATAHAEERLFRMAVSATAETQNPAVNYDAYMRPTAPDQNESLPGGINFTDIQPIQENRRARSLQDMMKQTAFQRPCDACKNTTCHCVIASAPAISAWS